MTIDRILRLAAARRYAGTGTARAIRQRAKLTLQEVADAVGVGMTAVSKWENGQRAPRGDAAVRWAELLADLEELGSDTRPAA